MPDRNTGACMVMEIPRERLTEGAVLGLIDILRDTPHYAVKVTDEEWSRHAKRVAEDPMLKGLVRWDWEPWTEISRASPLDYIPASKMTADRFTEDRPPNLTWEPGQFLFAMHFWRAGTRGIHPFPQDDRTKVNLLLEKWREAANLLEPRFALIDDFGKRVLKRKGEDLRRYAWGVTVYGSELVERVGRKRLLGASAWRVEELPWGGVWVQVEENPFEADLPRRRALEKELGLKEALDVT